MRPFCKNQFAPDWYERTRLILSFAEQQIHHSSTIPPPQSRPKLRRKKHLFHLEGEAAPEVLRVVGMLREDLEQPEVVRVDYHGVAGCRAGEEIAELYALDGDGSMLPLWSHRP